MQDFGGDILRRYQLRPFSDRHRGDLVDRAWQTDLTGRNACDSHTKSVDPVRQRSREANQAGLRDRILGRSVRAAAATGRRRDRYHRADGGLRQPIAQLLDELHRAAQVHLEYGIPLSSARVRNSCDPRDSSRLHS